jgi:protein SCO1/2
MMARKTFAGFSWLALLVLSAVACGDKAGQVPLDDYGQLPSFALTNQLGRELTANDLRGRVAVVDFIFTSCPDVCPLLTERLNTLRRELPANAPVSYVSISVDPEHDTPERLQNFAVQHGAVADHVWFLTGPFDQVKDVVTRGFKQAMELQPVREGQPRNVLHGSHFVLVDGAGKIRGYFPSDAEGSAALKRAVLALVAEAKHS